MTWNISSVVAYNAAKSASLGDARLAAVEALQPTVELLQASAQELVKKMAALGNLLTPKTSDPN